MKHGEMPCISPICFLVCVSPDRECNNVATLEEESRGEETTIYYPSNHDHG